MDDRHDAAGAEPVPVPVLSSESEPTVPKGAGAVPPAAGDPPPTVPDRAAPVAVREEAVTASAPAPPPAAPPALEAPSAPVLPPVQSPGVLRLLHGMAWPLTFVLLVVLSTIFIYPLLLARWRAIEGQAEAEAAYKRRRAELRAEAEAADDMLQALDKRVNLVSLGFREVVRKVTPTVVNVANYRELRADDGIKRGSGSLYFDPDTERHYRQTGVGSGLIVRPGYILTNHHVVRGADRLRITFASGQSLGVPLDRNVFADPVTDLAVLRLPADLPCSLAEEVNREAEFADSDRDVHRGDLVLALGSPLGLKQTVTHGIISAKGRLLDRITLVELLQTDAPINPGNSGGPLFDQYGRVAGINVAIASDNGANQGIGFAIPSNTVKKVFEQLVEHGEVPRGYIGVALGDLTRAQAEELGLKKHGGVLVAQVLPNQPAARAGMKVGDVIVRYNGEPLGPVLPNRHLRGLIVDTEVGRAVPVEVLRDGRRETLTLRIGKRPADLP